MYNRLPDTMRSDTGAPSLRASIMRAVQIVFIIVWFSAGAAIALALVIYFTRSHHSDASDAPQSPSSSDASNDSSASSPKFTIKFIYTTPMSDSQKAVFEEAKGRWERLIVKDFFTSVRAAKGLSICNQPPLEHDLFIDDLIIFAGIAKIDGPGKILGQAGPCGFDTVGRVRVGVMKFDEDDIGNHFAETVRHELGHVLGIGSVWEDRHMITPESQGPPIRYLGGHGNEGHKQIGGVGEFAMVETEGGPGTARSHWKDSEYPNEMMTGFLSGESKQPISLLTVLALADIGFTVDVSKADPFVASAARSTPSSARPNSSSNMTTAALVQNEVVTKDKQTTQSATEEQQEAAKQGQPTGVRRRRRLREQPQALASVFIQDELYNGPVYRFSPSDTPVKTIDT